MGACARNMQKQNLHSVASSWRFKVPALIRRCDDLPATITHVPVAAVLVLNTPDDGRLRPKHAEIKPAQCCIKLVFHLTYTMMHGSTKLKFKEIF